MNPTIKGKVYQVTVVDPGASTKGKVAQVEIIGGGAGDSHNKGYFATPDELRTAHPTAEAGDFAVVGSTDTIWVWDTEGSDWLDTDRKGEVTPDMVIIKSETMPTASTVPEGSVYQFTGTTNSTYTHGYIYECVSDGQDPATYSWVRLDVQPAPVVPDPLPDQTGHSGEYLKTDGSQTSWGKALENKGTKNRSLVISDNPVLDYEGDDDVGIGYRVQLGASSSTAVGNYAQARNVYAVAFGYSAQATGLNSVSVGGNTQAAGFYSTNIGSYNVNVSGSSSIVIGYKASTSSVKGSVAIGAGSNNNGAQATGACSIAIGGYTDQSTYCARATSAGALAIGKVAYAHNNDAICLGSQGEASGAGSIAMGLYAKVSGSHSVLIGSKDDGYSSTLTDANVFAFQNNNGVYVIIKSDGTIDPNRLGTGYDATKTQVLKNVQGVLTWVDEA